MKQNISVINIIPNLVHWNDTPFCYIHCCTIFKLETMKLEPRKIKFNNELDNDFIADVSISNMMQYVTTKMAQDINIQKKIVIKQKLKEIVGIEIDLQEESQRRFKRFCTVRQGNEETIYFNDGSLKGKRIVTFVDSENFTLAYY